MDAKKMTRYRARKLMPYQPVACTVCGRTGEEGAVFIHKMSSAHEPPQRDLVCRDCGR
jgi:hypothetical protein